MGSEMKEILIDSLRPFGKHSGRTYEGERLRLLMCSIEENGLFNPIIVRPIDRDKYEIISGHNRVKAMKELGRSTILAKIEGDLTEEKAIEIFYESNFNQQSFSDWNYAQRIEAVQYCEKKIKEYSQQGKRTDLERDKKVAVGGATSVQTRQKLEEKSKQTTTRDKMARELGISTATLSKYRRIIKLPDELLDPLVGLLEEKRINFEAAYVISNMRDIDIRFLIKGINKYPDRKPDLNTLKNLPKRNVGINSDIIEAMDERQVLKALIAQVSSDVINPRYLK
ncbi:MAG: ParB N-terminal domain-containing protein [Lachnospiraceae bacterium]|nr:ParB N-terminal domain-containing protein [Lachnospiraceae bacterium]